MVDSNKENTRATDNDAHNERMEKGAERRREGNYAGNYDKNKKDVTGTNHNNKNN